MDKYDVYRWNERRFVENIETKGFCGSGDGASSLTVEIALLSADFGL